MPRQMDASDLTNGQIDRMFKVFTGIGILTCIALLFHPTFIIILAVFQLVTWLAWKIFPATTSPIQRAAVHLAVLLPPAAVCASSLFYDKSRTLFGSVWASCALASAWCDFPAVNVVVRLVLGTLLGGVWLLVMVLVVLLGGALLMLSFEKGGYMYEDWAISALEIPELAAVQMVLRKLGFDYRPHHLRLILTGLLLGAVTVCQLGFMDLYLHAENRAFHRWDVRTHVCLIVRWCILASLGALSYKSQHARNSNARMRWAVSAGTLFAVFVLLLRLEIYRKAPTPTAANSGSDFRDLVRSMCDYHAATLVYFLDVLLFALVWTRGATWVEARQSPRAHLKRRAFPKLVPLPDAKRQRREYSECRR